MQWQRSRQCQFHTAFSVFVEQVPLPCHNTLSTDHLIKWVRYICQAIHFFILFSKSTQRSPVKTPQVGSLKNSKRRRSSSTSSMSSESGSEKPSRKKKSKKASASRKRRLNSEEEGTSQCSKGKSKSKKGRWNQIQINFHIVIVISIFTDVISLRPLRYESLFIKSKR